MAKCDVLTDQPCFPKKQIDMCKEGAQFCGHKAIETCRLRRGAPLLYPDKATPAEYETSKKICLLMNIIPSLSS